MLASLLPVPFADAARQRQYEAVYAALHAEAAATHDAPATVLLGNLAAWTALEADALLVRPAGWALLVLTPQAGHLTIPALAYGTWQLDRQPLPGRAGADNPFAQYCQQLPPAHAWLRGQLGQAGAPLPPGAGLALFEAPLTFGPEVEAHLHQQAEFADFQLVAGAAQLPARLFQLLGPGAALATEPALLAWADELAAALAEPFADELTLPGPWAQKLRHLWRWLGAEDIPADPPYGGAPPPDTRLRDQQEQARLQQLRQELQTELAQLRREATQREATRTQELAQLRQQLTYPTSPATGRLAEQEQSHLAAALRTTHAELAARNHELDARIEQLGRLIKQLQKTAASPAVAAPIAGPRRPPLAPAAPRKPTYRRLHQAERWGLVGLTAAIIGAGGWGVARMLHPPKNQPATATAHQPTLNSLGEENLTPETVFVYDSLTRESAASPDTAGTASAESTPSAINETPALIIPATPLHIDSARLIIQPSHLIETADSAAPAPSPTP